MRESASTSRSFPLVLPYWTGGWLECMEDAESRELTNLERMTRTTLVSSWRGGWSCSALLEEKKPITPTS